MKRRTLLAAVAIPFSAFAHRETPIVIYADGIHDDSPGLQACLDGMRVVWPDGTEFDGVLDHRVVRLCSTVRLEKDSPGYFHITNCFIDCADLPKGRAAFFIDVPARGGRLTHRDGNQFDYVED